LTGTRWSNNATLTGNEIYSNTANADGGGVGLCRHAAQHLPAACPEVDLPFRVGQAMTYVFDFGDWWEFDVTLERVDPDMAIEEPAVLEKHGEPPDQYGW
jgi:hypothetical protein